MPNFIAHAKIGAVAGAIAYTGMCKLYDHEFDMGELIICSLASTAAAAIPDILEPALTPNHRGVAHSLTVLTLAISFLVEHLFADHQRAEVFTKILIACLGTGYVSHLLADARTPRALPVLC